MEIRIKAVGDRFLLIRPTCVSVRDRFRWIQMRFYTKTNATMVIRLSNHINLNEYNFSGTNKAKFLSNPGNSNGFLLFHYIDMESLCCSKHSTSF